MHKKIWGIGLLFLVLFSMLNTGECAGWGGRDWNVPFLGTFHVPSDLETAEFKDLKSGIAGQATDAGVDKFQAGIKNSGANSAPISKKSQVAVYNLTIDDGDTYHMAMAFLLKDGKDMTAKEKEEFEKMLLWGQKMSTEKMQQEIYEHMNSLSFMNPKTQSGMQVLEIQPFDFFTVAGKQAFGTGIRLVMQSEGIKIPLYGRLFVFNSDKRLAGMLVITTDSDRKFWESLLKDVVPTLELAPGMS